MQISLIRIISALLVVFCSIVAQQVEESDEARDDIQTAPSSVDSLEQSAALLADDDDIESLLADTLDSADARETVQAQIDVEAVEHYPGQFSSVPIDSPSEEPISVSPKPAQSTPKPTTSRLKSVMVKAVRLMQTVPLVDIFKRFAIHILLLMTSAAVIITTLVFLLKKRDSKRFLTTTRLSVVDKEVRRACNFIERNFARDDLNVDTVSDELISSPAFLQALFERELGMSVDSFIDQVRINRARIKIAESPDISPDELAGFVGYEQTGILVERFAQITGISLKDYRENV